MRVVFFWVNWSPPVLRPEQKMELGEFIRRQGVAIISADFIRANRGLLAFSIACAMLGVPIALALEPYAKASNGIGSAFFIFALVMFAWGIIQTPLYIASLKHAQHQCRVWLAELETIAPKPITCEFVLNIQDEPAVSLFKIEVWLDAINRDADKMRMDMPNNIDCSRHWEVAVRMLMDLYKEKNRRTNWQYSRDLCLSFLAAYVIAGIDYGDQCIISVSAAGDVTAVLQRGSNGATSVRIGKIPLI